MLWNFSPHFYYVKPRANLLKNDKMAGFIFNFREK